MPGAHATHVFGRTVTLSQQEGTEYPHNSTTCPSPQKCDVLRFWGYQAPSAPALAQVLVCTVATAFKLVDYNT